MTTGGAVELERCCRARWRGCRFGRRYFVAIAVRADRHPATPPFAQAFDLGKVILKAGSDDQGPSSERLTVAALDGESAVDGRSLNHSGRSHDSTVADDFISTVGEQLQRRLPVVAEGVPDFVG